MIRGSIQRQVIPTTHLLNFFLFLGEQTNSKSSLSWTMQPRFVLLLVHATMWGRGMLPPKENHNNVCVFRYQWEALPLLASDANDLVLSSHMVPNSTTPSNTNCWVLQKKLRVLLQGSIKWTWWWSLKEERAFREPKLTDCRLRLCLWMTVSKQYHHCLYFLYSPRNDRAVLLSASLPPLPLSASLWLSLPYFRFSLPIHCQFQSIMLPPISTSHFTIIM